VDYVRDTATWWLIVAISSESQTHAHMKLIFGVYFHVDNRKKTILNMQ